MEDHWLWWIAALLLVVAELATGTVYLLMVALGLAAGGVLAVAGAALTAQMVAAAIVAALGCWGVACRRAAMPAEPNAQRNPNVQMDVGNSVHVSHWTHQATATVNYRGAMWQARLEGYAAGDVAPQAGDFQIVALDGSVLVLGTLTNGAK